MSSLKDKVASITKAFGLSSKGSLRQDVDELCKATDVTFTTMKETVDALSCVCEFACASTRVAVVRAAPRIEELRPHLHPAALPPPRPVSVIRSRIPSPMPRPT